MTADLPASYVAREDLRLQAYRKLATLSSHEEVDDVESEWTDCDGLLPKAASALPGIAHPRAECVRLGIRDITVVSGGSAPRRRKPRGPRFACFPESQRAGAPWRVWPCAVYKEDESQQWRPSRKVRRWPRPWSRSSRPWCRRPRARPFPRLVRPGANIGPAVKPPVLARRSRRRLAATWRRASWRARTTPLAVVAVAGVLGSGLSACSTSPPAAMVNGEVISQTELSQNLQRWSSSPAYVASFDEPARRRLRNTPLKAKPCPPLP